MFNVNTSDKLDHDCDPKISLDMKDVKRTEALLNWTWKAHPLILHPPPPPPSAESGSQNRRPPGRFGRGQSIARVDG